MKISMDLDGTCLEKVEFFKELANLFLSAGHEVGILTGHKEASEDHDRKKLASLGFPDLSFYYGRPPEYMHLNGAHFKSMIIEKQGIDIHFDDYDYNHPDTVKLFRDLGQEHKIFRLKSKDNRFEGMLR